MPRRTVYQTPGEAAGAVAAHEADATAAHAASAVSFTPSGLIVATNVQAALAELDAEKAVIGHTHSGAYAPAALTQNAQTGTTYTPVLTDDGKLVELSNAAAITLTVPTNTNVAYPVGAQIHGVQTGAGQVTVVGDSGVTVNGTPGLKTRAQWSAFTLIKRATNTWLLIGDLAA